MIKLRATIASLLVLLLLLGTMFSMSVTAEDASKDAMAETALEEIADDVEISAQDDADLAPVGTEAPTLEPEPETEPAPVVGPVTGLKRTSENTDRVTLEWIGVSEVDGYRVYGRNADYADTTLKLVATVKTNSVTVKNLTPGHVYQFKVVAYKTRDSKIYEGDPAIIKTPTCPKNVSGFKLKSVSASSITLKWTKNTNCDGYILYRQSSESGGKSVKYKTLAKNTVSFTDKKVSANSPYYYRIYAYRKSGSNDIAYSLKYAEVQAVAGMSAPTDNGSTTRLNRILLSWNKSRYAKGYDIYYSTDNKTFKKLDTVTDTFYYSGKLKTGKVYYMRVYPFRYVGKNQTKVRGPYFGKKLKVNNQAYGKNPGKNYIEVSIRLQHMWMYVNGELYVSTPIVTGNANSMDTPRGFWSIKNKASPCVLTGAGYSSYVRYWMAFIGGSHGIHDASWRSSFGGQIYRGNGSHGCINTPYNNVKKMYQKAYVGEPVIVYY